MADEAMVPNAPVPPKNTGPSFPPVRAADDLAARLHGTTDASVWAAEFMRMYRLYDAGAWIDEGLMIGWFANAIETGRAAGVRSATQGDEP